MKSILAGVFIGAAIVGGVLTTLFFVRAAVFFGIGL
jgi:hypothetical protein